MKLQPKSQIAGALLLSSLGALVPASAQMPLTPQAQTTLPQTTLPQTTLPQTTLPQTTLPQTTLPQTTAPLPNVPTPNYKIAAGDVLNVNVVDFPNLSVAQMVVSPDGTVSMPLVGQVTIAGDTVEQATTVMTRKWKKYVIDPAVTVSLMQMHQQTVVFNGAVNHPGVMQYRPGLHLIEALAEAGGLVTAGSAATGGVTTVGLQTSIADPTHSIITHEDGTRQVLDLSNPQQKAGTETDLALEPGDVVYVPQQLGKISVVGEVRQPGTIPYRENVTVLDALSDCGGFNPDTADLVNAQLTHGGITTPINLDPLMRRGDFSANIVLEPGDRLAIPELKNRTYVYGDVNKQSFYFYKPGDRLLDALSGVGGPGPGADLSKINVIHADKLTKQLQLARVNLNDFLLKGNLSGNPIIQPGDSLYIPQKGYQFKFNDLISPLYAVGAAERL